jgi:hypothetical protein
MAFSRSFVNEVPWYFGETMDGKRCRVIEKENSDELNPLNLLAVGVEITVELETHYGFDLYLRNCAKVKGQPPCKKTRVDMPIPRQAFEDHIGKTAKLYLWINYDIKEREHYERVERYHVPLEKGGVVVNILFRCIPCLLLSTRRIWTIRMVVLVQSSGQWGG